MKNKKWRERVFELPDNHRWTSRPGCKILVLERGAVRLDYPEEWVVTPTSDCMQLNDKAPPDDNCRLGVSFIRLPRIDWSGLPLTTLLESGGKVDPRPITRRGEIIEERRGALEIAWRELWFSDPQEHREACSFFCMARKGGIQALLTFDFWVSEQERCRRIWTTVLKSLELDMHYADPLSGRAKSR